ncbi:MAG: hypothetical protein FJ308_04975 [Planctomycetes bacterium]|nr:hypothetical protein [Planctomycetota bacterium]
MHCDVAIVGGGLGGTTLASLLKKYAPSLDVCIFEKEAFPRDHVGESQLPPTSAVLHEMGVWDKVEAAGFPIKLGASYTWGKTTEPWVFGFIPESETGDISRPGAYDGWRKRVAFQVDRSLYDAILLEHTKSLGVRVSQPSRVSSVQYSTQRQDKRVEQLTLESGEEVTARYYVDASGNAAVLRRQLGIEVEIPTLLKNVAFWDYWTAQHLNQDLLEKGTARVMIRSVGFGWIWYIVLSEHRTSVGVVCNAEYFKACGLKPEALYHQTLSSHTQISSLLQMAQATGTVSTTTDWSYVAKESCGENWFLVGESLGFADPILAAGLTLTHTCAEHCAYTILDLERGIKDSQWLRDQYHATQSRRVRQHMKFAEYWYSANGLFTDVLDNCAVIAAQSGLNLSPQDAFRWLSHGGIDDIPGQFVIGGLGLSGVKSVQKRFSHAEAGDVVYFIDGMNTFDLDIDGAVRESMANPKSGEVILVPVLVRNESRLPLTGYFLQVFTILQQHRYIEEIVAALQRWITQSIQDPMGRKHAWNLSLQCLETLVAQRWVRASCTPGRHVLSMKTPDEGEIVYTERTGPARLR